MADNGNTIETLQIEVEASAKSAKSTISALSESLRRLSERCKGGCGLQSVIQELKDLGQAAQGIGSDTHERLANLAEALGKLRGIGKVTLPENLNTQIMDIGIAASAFGANAIAGLQGLSDGLTSLSQVGKISISSTLGKHLTEIADAGAAFNGAADTGFGNLVAALDMLKGVKDATISSTLGKHLSELAVAGSMVSPATISGFTSLADALRGFVGLESVKVPSLGTAITGIVTSLTGVDGTTSQKLSDLGAGLRSLSDLPSIPASLGERLNEVVFAVEKIGTVDTSSLQPFVESMRGLSDLKISSNLNTQISKLAETAEKLKDVDFSGLTEMNNALAPLARTIGSLSQALPPVASGLSQVGNAARGAGEDAEESKKGWEKLFETIKDANFWSNLGAKIKAVFGTAKKMASVIGNLINTSNQYVEDVNLFNASMGKYAAAAQEYAEKVGNLMGIDPGAWMRNQGVFNTIITGFGVVGDRAYIMSKNLTQLGYDISSFFNISVDDAMKKLSSGISGELEPLRRLGYDLSVARLQEEAHALGITKKVSAMTQAEKAELRYHAILTQVTTAQGDMARTLETPANQIRILKAQVEQCARALGNIFIPILNQILPYLIAFAKAVRTVAEAIAGLVGFKMPEVDYSSVSSASDAVAQMDDNLTKSNKSAKKLTETLAHFDELNIIAQESGGGSSNSSKDADDLLGGKGFDFDLPEYDFLGGLTGSKADEILAKWKPTLDWIISHLDILKDAAIGVAAGFMMWRLGKSFGMGLTKTLRLTLGIGLAVYAIKDAYGAFKDQWENGVTLENMQTLMRDTAILVLGLGIAFRSTGLAVGLLIGGVAMMINPLKELAETGQMADTSLTQLSIGLLLVGAAISFLTGGWIPLLIAGVIVAVAWIVQKWDEIKATFELGWQMLTSWWNETVVPAFNNAKSWLYRNVILPVKTYFKTLWASIKNSTIGKWFSDLWKQTIYPVVSWIDTNIIQPIKGFFSDLWGSFVDTPAVQSAIAWFSGLWDNGKGFAENVKNVATNITNKIGGYFTRLWGTFTEKESVKNAIAWFKGLWDPNKGFAENVANVATNITDKIGGFFTDLWGTFTETETVKGAVAWFNGLWDENKGFAENVANVATNITEKIGGFFSDLWGTFTDTDNVTNAINWFKGLWDKDKGFAENIANVATNITDKISGYITGIWDDFKDTPVVQTAIAWWNNLWAEEGVLGAGLSTINDAVVKPVSQFFTDIWDNFKETETGKAAIEWWEGLWGGEGFFQNAITGIDTAVIQPIGKWFTDVWDNFKEGPLVTTATTWWNGLWGENGFFQSAISGVDAAVIQPVATWFSDLWGNFKDTEVGTAAIAWWESLWGEEGQIAVAAANAESIISGIGGFFTALWGTIKGDEENNILTWWNNLWGEGGFLGKVEEIKTKITEPIESAFSAAATAIETAWSGVSGFFTNIVNGIIDGINWLINQLNKFNVTLGGWKLWDPMTIFDIPGVYKLEIPGFTMPKFTIGIQGIPTIPRIGAQPEHVGRIGGGRKKNIAAYAEGGFPDMGQLFLARERGAELVGEIGGRTAVANNEQIDRGIAEGVRDANAETNEILREIMAVAQRISNKKFSLEPSTALARTVKRSEEMRLVTEGV